MGFYIFWSSNILLFICIFQWTDLRGGMRPDGSWKEWQFKFLQAILHTDTEPRQINWVKNFYWWIHWCFHWYSQHFNFHNDTISWIENLLKTWDAARIIERLFCNSTLTGNYFNGAQNHWSQVHWPNIVLSFLLAIFCLLPKNFTLC